MTHDSCSSRRLALGLSLALLGLVSTGCGGDSGGGEAEKPQSLLFISIDTTIPEVLSCYRSGGRPTTPFLDSIASEGILFENARTVAPMTLPAHASMLTGLYPPRHTVRMNGAMILPDGADTLADRAKESGYQTAAFVAAVVLGKGFGLEQGFDVYNQATASVGFEERLEVSRTAEEMVDVTLEWMRDQRDPEQPFFVWLHFFDPHAPYDPPKEFLDQEQGNAYSGEVAYMDAEIGRLMGYMKEEGLWDETVVAVVSDHGEGLGRKGQSTHATCVFDTTIRVPMLLRHPDGRRAGERVKDVTSVVDLYPTLVQGLGWGRAQGVDGYDLWRDTIPEDRGVYFESYYGFLSFGWSPIAGWADRDGKYHNAGTREFFEFPGDLDEDVNLLPGGESNTERYTQGLQRIERRPRLSVTSISDESGRVRAQLEALGYAGGSDQVGDLPEPSATVGGPSPHLRIQAEEDYLRAREYQIAGRADLALPLLERITSENPRNHTVTFNLGLAYMKMKRFEEALTAFDLSIKHREGSWMGPILNKAVVLRHLGRMDEAMPLYDQAFAMGNGPAGALPGFVEVLREIGDTERLATFEKRLEEQRIAQATGQGKNE
ncbi:MAG: choline-sulfatase [Planctomycetota bacterium]|jgi:choline-sulfatase